MNQSRTFTTTIEEVRVVDWVDYDTDHEESIGGLGGWFNAHMIHGPRKINYRANGAAKIRWQYCLYDRLPPRLQRFWINLMNSHTWEDYLQALPMRERPYARGLRSAILSEEIRITGDRHQNDGWTPLFADGTVGRFSYRSWGDLMAAIYTTKKEPLTYMAFYM